MSGVFRLGAVNVGDRPIKVGLLYQDERDKIARVYSCREGVVVLTWLSSDRRSQCSERQFRKRFSLYGHGHVE